MADIIPGYGEGNAPFPDRLKKPKDLLELDMESFVDDIDLKRVQFTPEIGKKQQIRILAAGIVSLSNLIVAKKAETLVLMDKSARPIAHLLTNLWREIYPGFGRPDIRFINVGQESSGEKNSDYSLKQLYRAHFKNMNGKTIIVADEKVHSGRSIRKTKKLIEDVFPEVKKAVYTSVFEETPDWYGETSKLGVYDINNLPTEYQEGGRLVGIHLKKSEKPTYIAKTVAGVVRRNPKYAEFLHKNETSSQGMIAKERQAVNDFRAELSYLAKKIAGSCKIVDGGLFGAINPKPNLNEDLNEFLNETR